jgi:hypothetical protein
MKICFVTLGDFNRMWAKAMPQERFSADIPTLNFLYKKHNTLFIVGRQEDFIASVYEINPKTF